jgi:transposase
MSQTVASTTPLSASDQTLPTIWEVPDSLWEKIVSPILAQFDPPPRRGRPRADQRRCLDGILYRARTGCQWNQLPEKFGSAATVHRTLQRWESKGIFDIVWATLLYHVEALGGVHWEWQAADGMLNKARFIGNGQKGGIKRNSQSKGMPKQRRTKGAGPRRQSAPTLPTAPKGASRQACLSREAAVRLVSVSPEPM